MLFERIVDGGARRAIALLWASLALCGCARNSTYNYAGAGLGATVAATAIYRGISGDCWARCTPGYICNRERGTCEPGECMPACAPGYFCLREPDETLDCVADSTFPRLSRGGAGPNAGAPVAGTVDAGALAD
jgi:hypothetical protein